MEEAHEDGGLAVDGGPVRAEHGERVGIGAVLDRDNRVHIT